MATMLDRCTTPRTNNPALEYQTADSKHDTMGASDVEILEEVPAMVSHGKSSYAFADLPKAVVMTLDQGSVITCLEFHPQEQNIVLEVTIWDIGSRDKLFEKDFKVSGLGACSQSLQATLANDYAASINRVNWSPDGKQFGVALSKNVVQIYSYHGGDDTRKHLEAHAGSVNDLAFSYPNNKLSIVTCGDDNLIKVWDAVTGAKQFELKGHDAPVSSVCPHSKNGIQEDKGMAVRYPVVLGSALLELCILILQKTAISLSVKFWDMNSARLLTLVDLEPDSSISSFVRFNRSGMLIAVATLDRIKILANPDGVKLLNAMKDDPFHASGAAKASAMTASVTASESAQPSTMSLLDTDMVKSGSSVGPSSTTTLGATNLENYGIGAGPESGAGPSTTTVGAANKTGQSHK
nr:topless-related protein 4-like isoform X2 [Tanacetum cinerariifolium]